MLQSITQYSTVNEPQPRDFFNFFLDRTAVLYHEQAKIAGDARCTRFCKLKAVKLDIQSIYVFADKMRGPMSPIWLFSLPKPFPPKYIFQTLCLANIRQRTQVSDVFRSFLKSLGNFLSREPILFGENVNVKKFSFDADHRYSLQLYIQLYCTIVEKKLLLDRVRFQFS